MMKYLCMALTVAALLSAQAQTSTSAPSPLATPLPAALTQPAATSPWMLPSLQYFIARLPAPPKPGSFRDRLDVRDAISQQAAISPDQMQHLQWSYNFSVFNFSEVLGNDFTAQNYPKTAVFFTQVASEANIVITGLKNYYHRLRPFQAHPDQIKLYVKNEPGYGYPSGHTTRSRLFAYILAYLSPAHRRPFLDSAEQVGLDRILAGEHYQTDLEAGRKLGKMLFFELMKDPKFRQQLADLSAQEWMHNKPNKPSSPSSQ